MTQQNRNPPPLTSLLATAIVTKPPSSSNSPEKSNSPKKQTCRKKKSTIETTTPPRWQKNMHFLLSSMSVVYVLTTLIPEDGENDTVNYRIPWRPNIWLRMHQHTLKHQKNELTLVELGSHLRTEESLRMQDNDKPNRNNVVSPSVVNTMEHNNFFRLGHFHFKKTQDLSKDGLISAFDMETEKWFPNKRNMITLMNYGLKKSNLNYLRVWGCKEVVRLPDPNLKTLGERGIECIFVGYAEHSKAFRPSLRIPNGTEDFGGLVVPEKVTEKKEAINDEMDSIMGNNTWVLVDLSLASLISIIRLLIALASIHNLIIHQMDVKTAFLDGELEEETPKQWHQKFDEVVNGYLLNQPGKCVYNKFDETGGTDKGILSSRFSMKDMGEAYVILGIRIKHKSNDISISQSHYIKKASKKQTYITGSTMDPEFIALVAAGKEAEWLRNLILDIPLWSKPIAPISIHCDSAATLEKTCI
uniref:Uncharacterized protein n=1 Tax=Tanacetum cinerariifolium TaxID=118510 RepID=A0A6L2N0K5_TANCI|nr:hypothetical protein [Tanacetum cinerariifolium]